MSTSVSTGPKTGIADLSVELLTRIFTFYAHQKKQSNFKGLETRMFTSIPDGYPSNPTILSHVCKHWRAVSIAIPTLWSTIVSQRPIPSHVDMAKLWLERSGTSPLTLHIFQTIPDDGTPVEYMKTERQAANDLLKLFMEQMERWQNVKFFLCIGPLPAFENFPQDRFPLLKNASLNLATWTPMKAEWVDRVFRAVHSAPCIESVTWNASFYLDGLPSHVPWQRLKHFELDLNDVSEDPSPLSYVFDTLSKCPQVESIKFTLAMALKPVPRSPPQPVTFVNLKKLVLDEALPSHLISLLKFITAPALEELRISLHPEEIRSPPALAQTLGEFISRSKCTITNLGLDLDEAQAVKILPLPGLKSLEVLFLGGTKSKQTVTLLTRATGKKVSSNILPKLQYLHFVYQLDTYRPHTITAPVNSIRQMINSRTRARDGPLPPPDLNYLRRMTLGSNGTFQIARVYAELDDVDTPFFGLSAA
ncbi:hypothetical protein CVT24_001687 [Panaeolus cyanescens]|uniref:F-box domain-containing protein n=1 Tax=Panaeolus cyanescens TaxID=181874 RepID=A0A409YFP1_9AGAR|nr:hypothetical protein CVT24_001687 [Panaeolus cyanescens]